MTETVLTVNWLDIPFTNTSTDSFESAIEKKISSKEKTFVCFANAQMVSIFHSDKEFQNVLFNAGFVFPDGMPIVLTHNLFRRIKLKRVAGMDYFSILLKRLETLGLSAFFYGNTRENLDELIAKVRTDFPGLKIAGSISPPFRTLTEDELTEDINQINHSNANAVFVSLGCPKQEYWMHTNSSRIDSVLFGVGNAFLTFTGKEKRIPKPFRNFGIEWIYRLFQDPSRLAKRYFLTNSHFIWILFKTVFKKSK